MHNYLCLIMVIGQGATYIQVRVNWLAWNHLNCYWGIGRGAELWFPRVQSFVLLSDRGGLHMVGGNQHKWGILRASQGIELRYYGNLRGWYFRIQQGLGTVFVQGFDTSLH